jgi:hypothetical protein
MSNIYTECITTYSFVHFHLLDGYLNPDYGSTIQVCKSNIDMMNNLLKEFDNDLSNKIEINLYKSNLDYNPTKYNIIQVLYNKHATSFVSFIHNDKLNFLFFNSGKGIELHEKYDDKYLPFFGYSIDNTADNEKYFIKIIKVIELYNSITNYKLTLFTDLKVFKKDLDILLEDLNEEKKNKIYKINLNNTTFEEFIIICDKIIELKSIFKDVKIVNSKIDIRTK